MGMISYTIEAIENGWTLTTHIKDEEGEEESTQAFTYKGKWMQKEGRENQARALMEILDTLSEELLGYNEWEDTNVKTQIVKGHKCD